MLSLPILKDDNRVANTTKTNLSGNNNNNYINNNNNNENYTPIRHQIYDYFSVKIPKPTIEMLFNLEKDERYLYFLRYGFLRRYEGKGDILYVEIPQIPKNIVIYRRPAIRNQNTDKLYLNKKDLPHIPLLEGEENLKLLSLETNLISKIDHLISLNNLLFLNLYENRISEIENLHTVPKLKALMLGKNQITRIKNLNCLVDIEVLDLHSNKIKLIENLFSLKKLRILNLANNQLTSFVELMNNKNLEDLNLRKNLIVSIPNLTTSFDKLKKINLGRNMISKIEFILEFKKLKKIEELYIEGNPVIYIKDVYKKFFSLPLKFKDQTQYQMFKNNCFNDTNNNNNGNSNNAANGLRNSTSVKSKNNFSNSNGSQPNNNENNNNSNLRSMSLNSNIQNKKNNNNRNGQQNNLDNLENNKFTNENNNNKINNGSNTTSTSLYSKPKSKQSNRNEQNEITAKNNNNNKNGNGNENPENLSEEEREKLLKKIEAEWGIELKYIINNGFNGYNIKKLKETKMQLCHAEIEREKQLNLFGNAIEVLGYKEFYGLVHTIKFEFINYDIVSQKQNIENIKKFINLRSLIFVSNNLHGYYQLIKLENIKGIEYVTIKKNEICYSELLKYFLIYRLQNIKYFNGSEVTNKDVLMSKKIFEHFDKAISFCENESQKIKNSKKEYEENGSSLMASKNEEKIKEQSNDDKYEFFNFVKINLNTALDEILDL